MDAPRNPFHGIKAEDDEMLWLVWWAAFWRGASEAATEARGARLAAAVATHELDSIVRAFAVLKAREP